MNIEVFTDFNSNLEKIWREFEVSALKTPFQSYGWLSYWQNIVGGPVYDIRPQIVVLKGDSNDLLAIFPLGIRKVFLGVRVLEWLGGVHSDYMGPLLKSNWKVENGFSQLWEESLNAIDLFDVIHFQKQQEHIKGIKNPFIGLEKTIVHLYSYHSNLEKSWKYHFQNRVKTKLKSDSRRQRRRLQEIGELRFIVAEEEKIEIVLKMIEQKRRRYRDTKVWDMLSVPEHREFYEKVSMINDDHVKTHIACLFVGDSIVATHFGVYDQSVFYYMMPAYEGEDWKKYSPGRLLLEYLMKWSIERGLTIFDFTVGGEQYKKSWCDTKEPLFEMINAKTIWGALYVKTYRVKHMIKRTPWLRKLVEPLNVLLKKKIV